MSNIQVLLFSLFAVVQVTFAGKERQCSINVKSGMHKTSPPLLVSPTTPPTYVYPEVSNPAKVVVAAGERLLVVCPGRTNAKSTEIVEPGVVLVKGQSIQANRASVQCHANGEFLMNGKALSFEEISCEAKARASYSAIIKASDDNCSRGETFEIGYELGEDLGFLKIIELCHDVELARTLWSRATIQPVNQVFARHSGGPAKNFKAASLYDGMLMSKNEPYNLKVAYNTLEGILAGDGNVADYLSTKPNERKFLAKGHLIANADMFYKSEQDSTYFYANVVPMWQSINANPGNWYFVEEYVRYLAYRKQRQLEVYVGGLGTLQLEGKTFSLFRNEKIPVPKLLFKCVIDRLAAQALCFLLANNPYVAEDQIQDYVVCKRSKACDKVAPNYKDTTLGYLYCCNIREFYKAAQDELGLEELEPMTDFKEMELLPRKIK